MAAKKKAKRKSQVKTKRATPSKKVAASKEKASLEKLQHFATGKASKEKASLEDLGHFTTGKLDDTTLKKVANLEEVLGIKTTNPFGTNEPDIFEKSLKGATVSDLQNLCTKVGIFPDSARDRMKQKLREEFKRVTRGSRSIAVEQPLSIADPSHPNYEKAKKLFGEGF
jgi:hypothetical protein